MHMKYGYRALVPSLIVLIVLLFLVVCLKNPNRMPWSDNLVKDEGEGISDYSAVFLSNGQVYFGKLYNQDRYYVDLRDIYYLKVNQPLQTNTNPAASPSAAPQPKISLSKLGSELHGPNDRMHINRDQILFTESLKNDSQVVKEILNNTK